MAFDSSHPTAGLRANPPPYAPGPRGSEFPRGSLVARYVIIETLGKGGMGAVFSAYDPQLDRRVALKFLRTPWLPGEGPAAEERHERRARLLREAQAMARLSHPNVVTIYDVGVSDDGRVFLAMEMVDGGTIAAWLKERKRSWREIVAMFCQAGEGLAAAHRAGMIHRDFKPDNILIGADGRPRVTDFGLARSLEGEPELARARAPETPSPSQSLPSALSNPLTMTGALLGTPGYMAPEQYGGSEEIDARADIFAFCATLYRALYGERAFPGETVDEIASATLRGNLRSPPRGADVPSWVRRILVRGLSVERAERQASMEELLAALRADPSTRWRRGLALVAAAGALCIGATAFHAAGQRRANACRAAADPVHDVWNAERRGAIGAAFRATHLAYADDTWSKVDRALDGYAAALARMTEQACLATRVRGEQSEAALELRNACLDARLDEFRALAGVLATADAKTVEQAVKATRALSPVDACSNLDRLGAATRLPADRATRAEIRALQGEIAGAKALDEAGRALESLDRLRALADRVAAAHYDPLLVSWRMEKATSEQTAGDTRTAVEDFEEVALLADAAKLDGQRAAADIELGGLEDLLAHYDASHGRIRMASGAIARMGGDAQLEVRRDVTEGWVYLDEDRHLLAAPLFDRAIERARSAGFDDPQTLATAHGGLAIVLAWRERFEDALQHARVALRVIEDAYGSQHPAMARELNNLASIQLETGRVDDALDTAARSLHLFEEAAERGDVSVRSAWFAVGAQTMGEALLRAGRAREAAEQLSRAHDLYRASGEQEDTVAMVDNELADALCALGRLPEADAALREADQVEGEVKGIAPSVRAGTFAARARIALERRRATEALKLAESALSAQAEGEPSVYDRADARLLVARALARNRSDPERARALAEQARAGFAELDDRRRVDEASIVWRDLR